MRTSFKVLLMLVAACLMAASARAQAKFPPETRNAALRYWMGFVALEDVGADEATQILIEKTLAGQTAWDEAKLGKLIDDNLDAIEIMQRATNLPECDWGYEYSAEDPAPSVRFMANSARALARLNALDGVRLASKGDTEHAAETWLAGIRFSQHLAQGSSLLLTLTAKSTLLPNLKALTQAAQAGALTSAQREQAEVAVRALPESVFDWGSAWEMETLFLDAAWARLAAGTAKDPFALFKELTGRAVAADQRSAVKQTIVVPPPAKRETFDALMAEVAAALRLSPAAARDRLASLLPAVQRLDPVLTYALPSFQKVNKARIEIAAARAAALRALAQ